MIACPSKGFFVASIGLVMKKVWKHVTGYDHDYAVSNTGEVWNVDSGRTLKQSDRKGYKFVSLKRDGKARFVGVHRLVCEAFNGTPESDDFEVDHINKDPSDNRPANLEWVSHKENMARAFLSGIRGVASDGTVLLFPDLAAVDYHGYNAQAVSRAILHSDTHYSQGFVWSTAKYPAPGSSSMHQR